MRWTPEEGFFLLERHLRRLEASARYFAFACHIDRVRAALDEAVTAADRALRVRMLVGRGGEVRAESAPLESAIGDVRVGLARRSIDPANPFLFHKTTNRAHLERERLPGCDETILWNPAGEVTEAITANLVVEVDGRAVTPPVECGLLGGTMRAELLAAGEIHEARIPIERLQRAPRLWLVNSVRGWRPAVLDPGPASA